AAEEAAGFFTTKEAWEAYAPVAAPTDVSPPVPERVVLQAAVRDQLESFRAQELTPQVKELKLRIAEHQSPAAMNQLGVLYARYGLLDEASTHFERAGADGYLPALINQANVLTMRGRHALARHHLERARNAEPENARVLLGLATSYWESGDETRARDAFEAASALSPALAGKYPLFGDAGSESGTRAGLRDSAITFDWIEAPLTR
ncbi:MAG: tetratricopeptide repeat protein, partial [Spirochaetes bacterium]|nr:tetratricopeptide repeat protein [Spirochaetota bacterium]